MREPRPIRLSLRINGAAVDVECLPGTRLLDLLRGMGLTGVKEGCGEGECGACCVLLNGRLVNSCLLPAIQAQDGELVTIEGASMDRELSALQRGFLTQAGAQCGICTPGMVLAAGALLKRQPAPGEEEIRQALDGNLCRCTGYVKIIDSVLAAADLLRQVEADSGGPA